MFFAYSQIRNHEALAELFRSCHNLEKVFATRIQLEDSILEPLLHCRKMKVLDIAESLVSYVLVDRMFAAWPDLRLIDLSGCFRDNYWPLINSHVKRWIKEYPNVSIILNNREMEFVDQYFP